MKVVAVVAEQSGGQLEVAKVKNLQRVIEKACGYTGQQFSFDPTTACDLSRAKVSEEACPGRYTYHFLPHLSACHSPCWALLADCTPSRQLLF